MEIASKKKKEKKNCVNHSQDFWRTYKALIPRLFVVRV